MNYFFQLKPLKICIRNFSQFFPIKILSQAESRAHRIGQENPVVIRYLLAPGTADDYIWPLLQSKQKILKEAGLSKDSFENVSVNKQDCTKNLDTAEFLNSSITCMNTLDITSYFKSPEKSDKDSRDKIEFGNDDFDELVGKMDFDIL